MHTYLNLALGLMHDGHALCFAYGLVVLGMPVLFLACSVHMLATSALGMRMTAALLRRIPCTVGEWLGEHLPTRWIERTRKEAERAFVWLDGWEVDDDTPRKHYPHLTARAELVCSLPWV